MVLLRDGFVIGSLLLGFHRRFELLSLLCQCTLAYTFSLYTMERNGLENAVNLPFSGRYGLFSRHGEGYI